MKEEFDLRKGNLDERHHYLIRSIEDLFKMKHDTLEDFLCEPNQLEAVESFFAANQEENLFIYRLKSAIFRKLYKKSGMFCFFH